MTANFSRARYSKWPPPPSQRKTKNKRLLAHNELKGQKGVIFHQVWHYKSTGAVIVQFSDHIGVIRVCAGQLIKQIMI